MKKAVFSLSVPVLFVLTAFAAAAQSTKVAVIDTIVFEDENKGIRELLAVFDQLEKEFKPAGDELRVLADKINALVKELKVLANGIECGSKCTQQFVDKKLGEYDDLMSEYKQKEMVARKSYDVRKTELQNAVNQKIRKAIEVFGKSKGYALIFDVSKSNTHFLVTYENDVTAEFIEFYNENYSKREN